jgi:hypothetical protein
MRLQNVYGLALTVMAVSAVPMGLHAQDSTQMGDSVKHTRRHTRMDTTTSNGSVAGQSSTNQDQSGVVNKQGASTLGPRVKKTTPTQGQPVTAKGDTLGTSDSTSMRRRHRMRRSTTDSAGADSMHKAAPY